MIAGCLAACLCVGAPPGASRAMWLWPDESSLATVEARQELWRFLRSPKGHGDNRITTLFLANPTLDRPDSRPAVAELIAEAHREGIRVDYVCGDPSYATAGRSAGLDWLRAVVDYNRRVAPPSRFDGFQFDVEPHALADWPSAGLIAGYLSLLDEARSVIRRSAPTLKFGVAIPRWYDSADLHGLHRSIIDRVDYVAVMDFVNNSEAFVDDASNIVSYASRAGKKAWLGAETSNLPGEPSATFFALGDAAMERAFAAAAKAFSKERGFAGVAVEHYAPYRSLRP